MVILRSAAAKQRLHNLSPADGETSYPNLSPAGGETQRGGSSQVNSLRLNSYHTTWPSDF